MALNLARLRKLCAESGDLGSAEARDTSINTFLYELEEVVSEQVVNLTEDTKLRALYVGWVNQLLSGLDETSRINWLAEGVSITPAAKGIMQQEPQGNVFSLHARH